MRDKKQTGITLIALIITIIVMLILVAVSVSILINSGLIGKAKEAGEKTRSAYEEEGRYGENININGTIYNSIDEYVNTINGTSGSETGSTYGLSSDETYFVGQKSIGKFGEGLEDNTQKTNWDASKNGYVFETGHFIYAENYEYYDPVTGDYVTANVYLCWDADVTINSVANIANAGTWDIFSTSGVFLSAGPHVR